MLCKQLEKEVVSVKNSEKCSRSKADIKDNEATLQRPTKEESNDITFCKETNKNKQQHQEPKIRRRNGHI